MSNDGNEEVPIRIAEHFLKENLDDDGHETTRILDLLWDAATVRSLSFADLFGRRHCQIFELPIYQKYDSRHLTKTASWLFSHGATISSQITRKIYEPFASGLSRIYGGASFSEMVQSFAAEGKSQEMLEASLLHAYVSSMTELSKPGYMMLLASEFRQPQYYEADARKLAAIYNPGWPSSGESRKSVWQSLLSFRN